LPQPRFCLRPGTGLVAPCRLEPFLLSTNQTYAAEEPCHEARRALQSSASRKWIGGSSSGPPAGRWSTGCRTQRRGSCAKSGDPVTAPGGGDRGQIGINLEDPPSPWMRITVRAEVADEPGRDYTAGYNAAEIAPRRHRRTQHARSHSQPSSNRDKPDPHNDRLIIPHVAMSTNYASASSTHVHR
jgi:hypothetical protein